MEKIVLLAAVFTIIFLLILFSIIIRRLIFRGAKSSSRETEEKINILSKMWGETLDRNTQLITQQLNHLQDQLNKSLGSTAGVVQEIQQTLGKLGEENKRIFEVGKDISSLQELLRQPKFRGEVGEFFLENILSQIIPKGYFELQYIFKSGSKVDAIIRIGENKVAVDAKFPLDSFRRIIGAKLDDERKQAKKEFIRAVKKHVDDIANKYILPDEGTYDFAIMYIPAENVYYETIIKDEDESDKNIREYALSKKVVPVSPNSFYAYLMVVVRGLKGLSIEKRIQEVMDNLSRLSNDFVKFLDEFNKTGVHLTNARSSYERADKNLGHFEEKLKQIGSETALPKELS